MCSNGLPASPESLWQNMTVSSDSRTARLSGLRPATAYFMRVIAANEVGLGAPSHPPLLALTTQEGKSLRPTGRKRLQIKQFIFSPERTTCRRHRRFQLP